MLKEEAVNVLRNAAWLGSNEDREKVEEAIETLASAQPEIKPIDYQDCANAMLRMWMDKVVTDGEYNRIMDKLSAFWRTSDESD